MIQIPLVRQKNAEVREKHEKQKTQNEPPHVFKLVAASVAGHPQAGNPHQSCPKLSVAMLNQQRKQAERNNEDDQCLPRGLVGPCCTATALVERVRCGIYVETALVNIPHKSSSKIPVVLQNVTEHNVTLLPKTVIAEVMAAFSITPLKAGQSTPTKSVQSQGGKIKFDVGDPALPTEWKTRILEKLNSMPEVFAPDESHGHTTAVKHHIRLHDETPFKERPRPVHPCNREAVKEHLRELMDAGIIRESEPLCICDSNCDAS
ncbi:hypothetical protein SKAU_G00209080 [Synaphobranchus kaupii]|uniref:Uncharacterized protein n=1 Tax=Synaphobranchus kaupii TaxID=118154 RepID=A0A9Q1IUR2_SYNKA|nr:hypothetical protein SKAU_G00209080 [Synaphobranchus kaupii]